MKVLLSPFVNVIIVVLLLLSILSSSRLNFLVFFFFPSSLLLLFQFKLPRLFTILVYLVVSVSSSCFYSSTSSFDLFSSSSFFLFRSSPPPLPLPLPTRSCSSFLSSFSPFPSVFASSFFPSFSVSSSPPLSILPSSFPSAKMFKNAAVIFRRYQTKNIRILRRFSGDFHSFSSPFSSSSSAFLFSSSPSSSSSSSSTSSSSSSANHCWSSSHFRLFSIKDFPCFLSSSSSSKSSFSSLASSSSKNSLMRSSPTTSTRRYTDNAGEDAERLATRFLDETFSYSSSLTPHTSVSVNPTSNISSSSVFSNCSSVSSSSGPPVSILFLRRQQFDVWKSKQSSVVQGWLHFHGYTSFRPGKHLIIPTSSNESNSPVSPPSSVNSSSSSGILVMVCFDDKEDSDIFRKSPFAYAALAAALPNNQIYRFCENTDEVGETNVTEIEKPRNEKEQIKDDMKNENNGKETNNYDKNAAVLGWALSAYSFNRYKSNTLRNTSRWNGNDFHHNNSNKSRRVEEGTEEKDGELKENFSKNRVGKLDLTNFLEEEDAQKMINIAAAFYLTRDLINTPAEDMGPFELQSCAEALAARFGASVRTIIGEELLKENYFQIYAVGRGASGMKRQPRLIDLRWTPTSPPSSPPPPLSSSSSSSLSSSSSFLSVSSSSSDEFTSSTNKSSEVSAPRRRQVVLIGKGVCFDSGGLDIKSASGMLSMKKDMGGAATVLGLARLVMSMNLNIDLRVLIPAVENAVDGSSFRPGDVLTAKNGKTTEVCNTDAEGRLVLADALVAADSERPDIIIDFATLTGAARVALGAELIALFCNNDEAAEALLECGRCVDDEMWRLPLWKKYREALNSDVADLRNVGESAYGGAIIAALYLQEFLRTNGSSSKDEDQERVEEEVEEDKRKGRRGRTKVFSKTPWIHLDINGFNNNAKPGKFKGGEAQGLRAVYEFLVKMERGDILKQQYYL